MRMLLLFFEWGFVVYALLVVLSRQSDDNYSVMLAPETKNPSNIDHPFC